MAIRSFFLLLAFIIGVTYASFAQTIRLRNGYKMPVVGFGTFLTTPEQVDSSVTSALENGYRHIDTASVYENEKDVGNTLKKWFAKGNKREDLFVANKLPTQLLRPSDVSTAVDLSLNNLGLDYLDLYLIHVPFTLQKTADNKILQFDNGTVGIDYSTDLIGVWKELEKQVLAGKIRSIGLSNFNKTQVLKIWKNSIIKPVNLQVETNAYIQQDELLKLCRMLGIKMTAYSPIGSGGFIHMRRKREVIELPALIEHPIVVKISEKHGKTPAQVALRYNLQRGLVIIPKSTNPKRIKENIDLFGFTLSMKDMRELKKLDQRGKYRKFDFLSFKGIENHPEYPFTDRIGKQPASGSSF